MSNKKHRCPFQAGTFLKQDFLTSKAFISLSKHGKTVILLLYLKCIKPGNFKTRKNIPRDTILNNGELELTYKELYKLGLTNKTITRAFQDVHDKGFIRVEHIGGGGKKDPALYSVIDDWRDYGTNKFVTREKPKSVKYGFCSESKN